MMDRASLFTEVVHPYLPKVYIPIYRSCTLLFTNFGTLLFTDYKSPAIEIAKLKLKVNEAES